MGLRAAEEAAPDFLAQTSPSQRPALTTRLKPAPPHPQPQPLCSLVQTRLSFVPTACLAHGVSWLTADTPGPLAEGMNEHTGA